MTAIHMKIAYTHEDHHSAGTVWEKKNSDLKKMLIDVFAEPKVKISLGCTSAIREHVSGKLREEGWALNVSIDNDSMLKVLAIQGNFAFQLQTGNISRVAYDLLKLQYLYQTKRIEAAALALPTKSAAKTIGDNIANAERIIREMRLFDRIITLPILVIAFD